MNRFTKSKKLDNVCYDIRGPVMEQSMIMESNGESIIKLNIGNPAPFDLFAPDEIIHDVRINLKEAEGYCDSKGIFPARKAIMQHYQTKNIMDVTLDDIYVGNGVSELITMSMQALLDAGDEILVPAPDYPLWTASVNLAGGKPVHYICDEENGWNPDIEDIESKITDKTKGIVIINPNNPTGAVYSRELLQKVAKLAEEKGIIVFADEIYDKIIYDGVEHVPMATLVKDVLCITFNGLSKSHRIAGFRVGWMMLSGNRENASDYIQGINMLSSMRLCSNVPAQYAIQTALGGYQSINDLIKPGGRLYVQRDYIYERINSIEGLSCTKPTGAFYAFPKIDVERFNIKDDMKFALDFLKSKKVLIVQGTGFNWKNPDHFRIVFLPNLDDLKIALDRLEDFLKYYRQ
ncbi:pyridoxal phosphate-dependent aminotransferase [Alkalibacter mobilis]|uniref:pyridoxal phosphate-dependent aminotransferase n=1 Tax=Alkalibacter mobilis TaxID=2787712 RepID=UPI0018A11A16|nr:pyridoxal phosphate-dependent aminotransferase [Alkalibacter mobilis]MBF7096552.1 pyridoxal phosphate-dependent aminotransferase [Alkalibacter mobilis]